MKIKTEPVEAFPYRPPTEEVKILYEHIFKINKPLKQPVTKLIFDKLVAATLLLIFAPIMILLKIAYLVEGALLPENSGPMFFYYWAVTEGRKMKKWKIRLIKEKYIDQEGAAKHEWIAFSSEWNPSSRTYVGAFVKKWYLDEIPQFWSILIGDMSLVGPRPLSVLHYERDLAQGNVTRKLLRGGLLGLGHINKGTDSMGDPTFEYEYIDQLIKRTSWGLFKLDLWILWKGFLVVTKGGGH